MTARVALFTTNLARGGAETSVAQLARGLRSRGWAVSVISMLPPSAYARELETDGVPVYSLGMRAGRASVAGLARLLTLLRRIRPQILHCHMFHANVTGRLIRLLCPVPAVLSTLHSIAESPRRSERVRARDLAYRVTEPLAAVTVAVSEAVAERHMAARAAHPGKLRVIPNGVDTDRFRPDPGKRERVRRELGLNDEFAWLAVGRLMWKKGYGGLLRAFATQEAGVLFIAGSGPQEEELRRQAGELGVRARFLGEREDIPGLMAACDAYVQASLVEGLPVALLEAAASGLVAVATDAGGTRDVLIEGRTGFLTPLGHPEAMAIAMSRLAGLPEDERKRMGEAARAHVQARFEAREVLSHWEDLYKELAARWT